MGKQRERPLHGRRFDQWIPCVRHRRRTGRHLRKTDLRLRNEHYVVCRILFGGDVGQLQQPNHHRLPVVQLQPPHQRRGHHGRDFAPLHADFFRSNLLRGRPHCNVRGVGPGVDGHHSSVNHTGSKAVAGVAVGPRHPWDEHAVLSHRVRRKHDMRRQVPAARLAVLGKCSWALWMLRGGASHLSSVAGDTASHQSAGSSRDRDAEFAGVSEAQMLRQRRVLRARQLGRDLK